MLCENKNTYQRLDIYTYMHVLDIYIHICMCMYVYVYIYITVLVNRYFRLPCQIKNNTFKYSVFNSL